MNDHVLSLCVFCRLTGCAWCSGMLPWRYNESSAASWVGRQGAERWRSKYDDLQPSLSALCLLCHAHVRVCMSLRGAG